MNPMRTLLKVITVSLSALALVSAAAYAGETQGPTLLTVTGAISQPNRAAFDADKDKFFGYSEVEFDNAAIFDFATLQKMETVIVTADFPKGGPVHSYKGPLLADVLAAAGATGKTVTVRALDGYAVEAPLDEMIAQGAVVAYQRNGEMFGIGDFGPTQIVFPRAERDDLSEMSDDWWVWSIFHILVE